MFVIDELTKKYGIDLKSMRILLLNAGGKSQRLMSASALGKLSLALPVGQPMLHQLDIVIANFLPLLPKMKPGFFHGAADVIITYHIGNNENWNFLGNGFTALAHHSDLTIGTGHGVYILRDEDTNTAKTEMRECIEVLQKPSIEKMYEKCAVHIKDAEKYVYTDSVFFFDFDTADKLLKFYRDNNGPFPCELCSYGDFLQGLGANGNSSYCDDVKNVTTLEPTLVEIRKQLYNCLKGTSLNIMCMNDSSFFHLGTTQEYLDHFCATDGDFMKHADVLKQINLTLVPGNIPNDKLHTIATNEEPAAKRLRACSELEGCVIHSKLIIGSKSTERSVIEYCDFSQPIEVGGNSIVSGCVYKGHSINDIVIPANTFMHSVMVKKNGNTKYVTIVCNTDDDTKKSYTRANAGNVQFLQHNLSKLNTLIPISTMIEATSSKVSLWNVKLFTIHNTLDESFMASLSLAHYYNEPNPYKEYLIDCKSDRYSISDVMEMKEIGAIIEHRNTMSDR